MGKINKNKIKVLRIIGECKTGGTETISLNYYMNLNHERIAMDFLFYGDSLPRFDCELESHGDSVINVVEYTKDIIGSIKQIKVAVENGNYDIVHAQLNALNILPLLGAYLGGAKIRIAANHSTANLKHETKKSIIKYALRSTTKLFATHYAACSKFAGQWCFGKSKLRNGKIKIIHNAINLDEFSFSQEIRDVVRHNNGWDECFVIGHAGRFTTQKNHKFIIDIFSEIHKKCPEAILVLAGDGYLMDEIKNKTHELGLDECVQFLGVRFDMNQLMQGMDVFLFPSLYEGLGNVITEAQAVSLQSVVSNSIPNEINLTEYVNYLPLSDSIEKWAETVLSYRNEYFKRNTHEELIKAGYEIRTAAKDLEDYYYGLIESI